MTIQLETLSRAPRRNILEPRACILLVEDDPNQALLVERWLSHNLGAEVIHTSNGHEGARLAATREWSLVISDIELPGMSGLDVLRHSKLHQPLTPALLMTAHEKMEFAIEALHLKADEFVIKPLRQDSFLERVVALVSEGRAKKCAMSTRVLAIGAHPDDVEIGCGGTLVRHREAGDEVHILTLTSGAVGGEPTQRSEESSLAARMLGARLRMGSLVDTEISPGRDTIGLIERALDDIKPHIVYTHSINDRHQDHRNAHLATTVAARQVSTIYCYQSPSTNIAFKPSRFVEIEAQLEQKMRLLSCYRSQTGRRAYLTEEVVRSTAVYWGRFSSYKPVEPLEVLRSAQ